MHHNHRKSQVPKFKWHEKEACTFLQGPQITKSQSHPAATVIDCFSNLEIFYMYLYLSVGLGGGTS